MASKIKQKLAKNLYNAFEPKFDKKPYEDIFKHFKLRQNKDKGEVSWMVYLPLKENAQVDLEILKNSQEELFQSKAISEIRYEENRGKLVGIQLQRNQFVKDVIDSNPTDLNFKPVGKKIIVEYSSPNIAKPFHVGHLRSTIIGNFVANIKRKLENNVVRINYLGDWGTQLGIIQIGIEHLNYSLEDLKKDPITLMYQAYVKGNELAEKDKEVYNKAKAVFNDLEQRREETINAWNQYREWTTEELSKMYKRLGIKFDEYSWESHYNRENAEEVLKLFEKQGTLSVDEKGRKVVKVGDKVIPLIKSDDTTLYLIRDLMAVLDRKSRHKFDEMYYIVENSQSDHFVSLFQLCKQLNIEENCKLEHVKFGRIHGISTRKGNVIFLKDILDEAMERAYENQVDSKTTKVPLDKKDVADIIGVSSIVINDLKRGRKKDYSVSWERMLQLNGTTGTFLQYCHCRLSNLQINSGNIAASECDPEALREPEAFNLVVEIAKYESILLRADTEMESGVLVNYLFDLARASNLAFKVLKVKNSEAHLGSQRLLLFEKSRKVLEDGLKILGLIPLKEM